MIAPEKPDNEAARLEHLRSLNILDTLPSEVLDNITKLAASISGCEISLISLVDEERQWFKSRFQLDAEETSREVSFCAHAINEPVKLFEIEDAQADDRFHDNPLVTGDPKIRFYAGIPLVSSDEKYALGTLCVIDSKPKKLSSQQQEQLSLLSDQVMQILDYEKKNRSFARLEEEKRKNEKELKLIVDSVKDIIYEVDGDGNLLFVNQSLIDLSGFTKKELSEFTFWDLVKEEDRPALKEFYLPYIRAGKSQRMPPYRFRLITKNGPVINIKQTVQFEAKNGRIVRAYGLATDETEIVEISRKEREAYEKFKLLSEQSLDMICLVDTDGNFLFVSDSTKLITGYEASQVLKGDLFSLIPRYEDQEAIKQYHRKLVGGEKPGKINFQIKRKKRRVGVGPIQCQCHRKRKRNVSN